MANFRACMMNLLLLYRTWRRGILKMIVAADQRQLTSQECCLLGRVVVMGGNIISDLSREAVPSSSLEFAEGTDSDPAAIALIPLPTLHLVLVVASRSWPADSECSS